MMSYIAKLKQIYREHIQMSGKEARFLVFISFTVTFLLARIIVYGIKYHFLPSFLFGDISVKDTHIHHLVFGIIFLLLAGIIKIPSKDAHLLKFSFILYGVGAALTLDEFSLWLRLDPDAYFGHEGRISIDVVVLFTLFLISTVWFGSFWKNIFHHTIFFFLPKKYHRVYTKVRRIPKMYKKIFTISGFALLIVYSGAILLPHKHIASATIENTKAVAVISQPQGVCTVNTCRPSVTFFPSPTAISVPSITSTSTPTPSVKQNAVSAASAVTPTIAANDFCLNVPVLYYHHIQPYAQAQERGQMSLTVDNGVFDLQMQYLSTHGYTTLKAEQLVDALHTHTALPAKSAIITLDDAYDDNYTYAFPIFQKYHITANLMVPTGLLGNRSATNSYFTWDQLKEMVNSGLLSASNHTWSHHAMGSGSADQNQFEIATPQQQLLQNLGKTNTVFTYPYGSGYNVPWVVDLLKKNGIQGAFTTIGGSTQCSSSIYALHRYHAGSSPFPGYGIY